ncbi:hypothetical protein SG26_20210 (plasmid) [Haloarcula sp. CBA1115]|uniref:hypothetical protein n=1 Tax=unclassified Haloarcula TaxID=2624677 RepID=UPI00059554E3|nr:MULTISPECIES: hypothetical protein [unclassified Haloarcula]AJF28069.1 hypothetical protein SG26_20210 [Haloarcula sp. CBA1115]
MAHEGATALTDAVCAVAADRFADGETDPSVERAFAEDLLRFGIINVAETRRKLEKKVEEAAEGRMRKHSWQYPREKLETGVLQRIPERMFSTRSECAASGSPATTTSCCEDSDGRPVFFCRTDSAWIRVASERRSVFHQPVFYDEKCWAT